MIKEKELVINIPKDLTEVNIAQMIVFDKVIKMDKVTDLEKIYQLLAAFNGLDINDARRIPMHEAHELGEQLLKVLSSDEQHDIKNIISIKGEEYGLVPDFDAIETGAYIDLEYLMRSDTPELHKIMAVLYRPISKKGVGYYKLTPYSTEEESIKKLREDLFLKHMPYSAVRSVVGFILGVMLS